LLKALPPISSSSTVACTSCAHSSPAGTPRNSTELCPLPGRLRVLMAMSSPRCMPVVTFALVAIGSAACSIDVRGSEVSTREEKRFTVSANAPVDLNVRTFDGTISVRSWDRNEVLVEIERVGVDQASAEALVVNQAQEGNRIVIEAPGDRNQRNLITLGRWITPAVNFVVTAPRRLALQAQTSDGMIETRDLEGTIDMNSGDGRVVASNVQGEIKAHTGDGSIRIDQAAGRVEAYGSNR
jgi:hypothetical protein